MTQDHRIWDEWRAGMGAAGPSPARASYSLEARRDPRRGCRKRYQLMWKRNSAVSEREI